VYDSNASFKHTKKYWREELTKERNPAYIRNVGECISVPDPSEYTNELTNKA
jgi:hypothetical protein